LEVVVVESLVALEQVFQLQQLEQLELAQLVLEQLGLELE